VFSEVIDDAHAPWLLGVRQPAAAITQVSLLLLRDQDDARWIATPLVAYGDEIPVRSSGVLDEPSQIDGVRAM
jgi:hypothetical protein